MIGPAVDDGFITALKTGKARISCAVDSLDFNEVILADGSIVEPEVIICATGYSRGLEGIVSHLGVLATNGTPSAQAGQASLQNPGLYFIGFRSSPSGQIRLMSRDAALISRAIAALEGKT